MVFRLRPIVEGLENRRLLTVAINEFGGATYMAQDLTFGGVKSSGYGRMNGREGLRSMCNIKSVVEDRLPLHFPNKLFPVASGDFRREGA